jgi:hypothetical protein
MGATAPGTTDNSNWLHHNSGDLLADASFQDLVAQHDIVLTRWERSVTDSSLKPSVTEMNNGSAGFSIP